MSLESDLYNLLSTDASIAAVLNARPFVYLGAIPKGQPDSGAIVINVPRTDRLTGSDGPNRFTIKEAQFDSYHAQYTQSLAMSNAVLALMVRLSGSLATTQIQGAIATRDQDFGKEAGGGATGYVFRRLLALEVQHTDLQAGDQANTYTPSSIPAPGGNASLLAGVLLSDAVPTDGQVMVFSAGTGKWGPGAAAGGGSAATRHSFNEAPGAGRTVFTLPSSPSAAALQVFVAGMLQGTAQYSLNANTMTLNFAPLVSDEMFAWY